MNIDIKLSKRNRFTLIKLCKRLFRDYKRITISKRTIYLKRRWYSLNKIRIQVVDLVLLRLPQAINDLYEEKDLLPVFNYTDNIASAVEYFEEQEDIIQYLQYQIDDLDMSMSLNETCPGKPILLKEKEKIIVEETYATKTIFIDSVTYYYNLITDVIAEIKPHIEIVHINTESACNSPPIRAPGYAA